MLARMSKKALALLMVFCMVVSALSISALAIELPNGEYDGNFAFEYHITGAALDEMIEGTGYTRDDLSEIKLFFNGGAEKEIEKLPGQDTYMCSILAWELEEKAARNITMLSLTLNNGETSQVLTFGNEDLKAVYYNEILKTAFYELALSSSAAETYDDAWFFIRTDGVIPVETGSTDYDSGNYTPAHDSTVALNGKVDGEAVWTGVSGVIDENGNIDGTALNEAFASVAAHIKEAPSADAIAAALGSFDPNTQGIVWYVVKEKPDDVSSGCPGWHVDGVVYTKGTDEQFRTLTYYMNDGTETAPESHLFAYGAVATVKAGPTREGYDFTGWNTQADGKGTPYAADATINMTEDVNLYAQWKEKTTEPEPTTYNVTYVYAGSVPSDYEVPEDENVYEAGDTVTVSAEPTIPANYAFSGWTVTEPSGITITDDGKFTMPEGNVTLTGTWTYTDPGSNPGPSYNYYRVTVNYLDRADGSKIAESYVSPSRVEGSRYDVSEYDAIAIEGYTYDATEGDAVSGILNGNKTVNVYYMADETDIDDGDTPTTDLPDVPGEGDGGETDIGDGQTPTTDLPDTGDNGGETDIPDTGTPTGSLPQTGTLAQTSAARLALGALALTASVAAAGLALLLFRKSRKA